jgi:hypothetical protein
MDFMLFIQCQVYQNWQAVPLQHPSWTWVVIRVDIVPLDAHFIVFVCRFMSGRVLLCPITDARTCIWLGRHVLAQCVLPFRPIWSPDAHNIFDASSSSHCCKGKKMVCRAKMRNPASRPERSYPFWCLTAGMPLLFGHLSCAVPNYGEERRDQQAPDTSLLFDQGMVCTQQN